MGIENFKKVSLRIIKKKIKVIIFFNFKKNLKVMYGKVNLYICFSKIFI